MAVVKESYIVKLHDTDAAGILFFANQFKMVHDIYEQWLGKMDFGLRDRFEKKDFYLPIVHAEADFQRPLRVGDAITITLSVARIGKTSFTLNYQLTGSDGIPVGTASTVHVITDPATMKKIDLPQAFRAKFEESATGN